VTVRPPNPQKTNGGWLGWAIFLGVSWTWCIGMFLPVLLVRDYGVWAWVVFAVPNVVGAAAMGWFISADRSRLMVCAHRTAMTAFSIVTVAFQLFFAAWVFSRPSWQHAGCGWYLIGIVSVALAAMMRKSSRLLAAMILFASVACAIGMLHDGEAQLNVPQMAGGFSTAPSPALGWLVPDFLLGFLLCPYLDSTFHRARQILDDPDAKRAFGVGFGVIFLAAVVLTLLYSHTARSAMDQQQSTHLILRWIALYWMLQLGFTVGVHLIGDDVQNQQQRSRTGLIAIAAIAGAAAALALTRQLMAPGETIYLCFMSFYGLAFPAYVWLCIVPGRGVMAPSRRANSVFAVAVAIAAPMFWWAFIDHILIWGTTGVAVVLFSRVLISRPTESALKAERTILANTA
jgi:hypothetical protein